MCDYLYIKMDKSVEVTSREITIGDVAKITGMKKSQLDMVKDIKVLVVGGSGKQRYIVSIMKIIELVQKKFPNVQVVNIGETDCVVELKQGKKTNSVLENFKVIIVCLLLFFGAGFTIMAFNNDVELHKLFMDISGSFTENEEMGIKVLQMTYSIGGAVGIIVFYNHFGAKKLTMDPTPIEVEMREYEDEIYTALIEGHNRDDGKLDVE